MYKGSCECNAVNYTFKGNPHTCYACHCTDCQTSSGSAFGLSMIVNKDDVIIDGKLSVNILDYSGIKVQRHHCPMCGTALWFSANEYPDLLAIKPGTFNDTTWFYPVAHLWTRSAQKWVKLDDSAAIYEKQPEMSELVKLWSNRKNA